MQLDDHLRRRRWSVDDLVAALHSSNSCFSRLPEASDFETDVRRVVSGELAPTVKFAQIVADILIGATDQKNAETIQAQENFMAEAYVAECHGRRQQPPYVLGVIGENKANILARTVDQHSTRHEKINGEMRRHTIHRLLELEEMETRRESRRAQEHLQANAEKAIHGIEIHLWWRRIP